jgi:hypothetical protein
MNDIRYNIRIYPPTPVVTGEITAEQYIESCADELYNTWVCDKRFDPEDIKKLIDIGYERHIVKSL